MRFGIIALASSMALSAILLGACGEDPYVIEVPDCWTPEEAFDPCYRDAGSDASDAGADVAAVETDGGEEDDDAGPPCEGTCVPIRPTDYAFSFPHQVWFGPASDPAACPPDVKSQFVRYKGLIVPPAECPACSCGPSTGSCAPPSSFVAHAALCNAPPGAVETPFPPPDAWDGTCTAENAVPADLDCGGVPCIQSITVGPLGKTDDGCEATGTATTPLPEPTWESIAVACEGVMPQGWGGCAQDEMCVPKADPGFGQCVFIDGDFSCPTEGYTQRFLYYRDFESDRKCTDCTCGAVEGSACTATATIYKDEACGAFLTGTSINADDEACLEMNPGQALGSKQVTDFAYLPGVCMASGGELEGTAKEVDPVTFCCVP
ncbi:hypothetical protein [Polyangium aurulentum]|uniref:hypothetical protein n=1 Tax=Polyangium aurulentum TaxID=2567896 RepID=UPI0010AE08D5|nr:hypothetical protein [Polyangium aurulentum]UQA55547.1 hypothetical protein E8A73_029910 [Polyangium aurulentum]